MPLTITKKQELINGHQTHGTDTGSVEVQVAMLSERISQLSGHLQKNIHDFSSRQGLLKMIGRRKRLLSYLRSPSQERYTVLIAKLGIRGCARLHGSAAESQILWFGASRQGQQRQSRGQGQQ